jgi:hypothetical protein
MGGTLLQAFETEFPQYEQVRACKRVSLGRIAIGTAAESRFLYVGAVCLTGNSLRATSGESLLATLVLLGSHQGSCWAACMSLSACI